MAVMKSNKKMSSIRISMNPNSIIYILLVSDEVHIFLVPDNFIGVFYQYYNDNRWFIYRAGYVFFLHSSLSGCKHISGTLKQHHRS